MKKMILTSSVTKSACAAMLMVALGLSSNAASAKEAMIPPTSSGQVSSDPAQYQTYFQNFGDYKSWETNATISRTQVWTIDQGLQWRIMVTPNN